MSPTSRLPLLLVNAPYPRRLKFPGQPTSLLYAAGPAVRWLESERGEKSTRLLNLNLFDPDDVRHNGIAYFRKVIAELRPLIVGISTTTASLPIARRLAEAAKDSADPPVVIFGGPHEDDAPKKTAEWDRNVDISVSGDGESALLAIAQTVVDYELDSASPNQVLALLDAWKKRPRPGNYGNAQITARGITDNHVPEVVTIQSSNATSLGLDQLPMPPRHLLEEAERYHYPIFKDGHHTVKPTTQVMTARGCVATCYFCSESQRLLQRSASNVCQEIEALWQDGYRAIFFDDSTFTNRSAARRNFIREIGHVLADLGMEWGCQTRVDCVDAEIIRDLARAGCTYIYFGIESFVPHLLHALGKHYKPDQIENALRWCDVSGIRVGASLLLGAPDENHRSLETLDTARTTFLKVREYTRAGPIRIVSLNLFAYYPGTTSTQHRALQQPDIEDEKNYCEHEEEYEFPFSLLEEYSPLCPIGLKENARDMLLLAHDLLGDVLCANAQSDHGKKILLPAEAAV